MDALEFVRERNRMCKSFGGKCNGCPADSNVCCNTLEWQEDLVAIVEKWSAEHPRKTRQSEFLNMYPYAFINKLYGFIEICPADLIPNYRDDTGHCNKKGIDCISCRREFWTQEVE